MEICGQMFNKWGDSFKVGDRVNYNNCQLAIVIGFNLYNPEHEDSLIVVFDSGKKGVCFPENCTRL